MPPTTHRALIALALLAAAGTLPGGAQNLLTNGDFTSNLTSWTQIGPVVPTTGSAVWDSDSGSSAVGGLRIQVTDNGASGGGVSMVQCVDVSTGTLPLPWDFGARLAVVNQVNAPEFIVTAQFFPTSGCSGVIMNSTVASSTVSVAGLVDGAAASFTQLEGTRTTDPMPGGNPTASVRMSLTVATGGATTVGEAVFDSAYFGGDGTTPVTLSSFAVE